VIYLPILLALMVADRVPPHGPIESSATTVAKISP
jgi:hypothetical protein